MKIIRVIIIIGQAIDKALPLLEFISQKVKERKEEKLREQVEQEAQKFAVDIEKQKFILKSNEQ